MKRLFKFLLNLAFALIAVGITFVVLFFMTPSWQKVVVKRLLEEDPAREWLVQSVRIQPTAVEVGGLQVLDGPIGAEIQQARVSGPIWMAPVSGVIQIDEGRVGGLLVDLQNLNVGDLRSRDWQSAVEQMRNGDDFWIERINLVLSKLQASGWNFRISNLRVDGKILLPGGEEIPVRWMIVNADSGNLSNTELERGRTFSGTEL